MKKYLIILLMAMLPTLALAQQAGQHITRPGKPATTTTKPPKKQAPPKKQTTPKPPKKQSTTRTPVGSSPVTTSSSQSRPAMQNKTFTVNGVSFTMVAVEGGTFTMGATSEQGSDAYDHEKPAHSVTLSPYYIGQTEVTQELWQAVMGSNPSYFADNLQRPVETVSWEDCQTFITKLNELTGKTCRLPTEAEWEYAARGGNKSQGYKYAGSNDIEEVAWWTSNSNTTTHLVATKAPNELGLYDMSGNVWEWCQDWFSNYSSDAQTNPTGPTSGTHHVTRGGCWSYYAWDCRVSRRNYNTPSLSSYYYGLRLAL
jgi:formylglycine-generating enzyme required for sulfatase activity